MRAGPLVVGNSSVVYFGRLRRVEVFVKRYFYGGATLRSVKLYSERLSRSQGVHLECANSRVPDLIYSNLNKVSRATVSRVISSLASEQVKWKREEYNELRVPKKKKRIRGFNKANVNHGTPNLSTK